MTTEQMIEEALKEFKHNFGAFAILGKAGRFYNGAFANEARIKQAQDFLKEKLTTVATKSAEESVNEIGNLINSTKNDTEKLDLVVKYLNKDTNE